MSLLSVVSSAAFLSTSTAFAIATPKNTKSYETHQIRRLFDYSIPVTINTVDLLIFNAVVSQDYLNLYNSGLMTANELNIIQETGLSSM